METEIDILKDIRDLLKAIVNLDERTRLLIPEEKKLTLEIKPITEEIKQ